MAGAGKKTFTAGEVLTASDVNTYLMEQSVMVFGGTAARSSAVPTPSDGMVSYRTDADALDIYDGTAWQQGLTTGAWTAYTPTFTNLTIGNGTVNCAYVQIGKTVHVRINYSWGSTTSATSSPTQITLPVTAKNVGTSTISSSAYCENNAIAGYVVFPNLNTSANTVSFSVGINPVNAAINNAQPFTWGTGDFLQCIFTYEAA